MSSTHADERLRQHLEAALHHADDDASRYHLRSALQRLALE